MGEVKRTVSIFIVCVCARAHLGCVWRLCVCTCLFVHLSLSKVSVHGEDHMHTNTFSSPTVHTIITRDQKHGGELNLKLRRFRGKKWRLDYCYYYYFLYILPEVHTSHLWVSKTCHLEHTQWGERELMLIKKKNTHTHLSLSLLFCPIFFLLLESGRVCKSPSLCPRPYCVCVCFSVCVCVSLLPWRL